ncbi:DUF3300 domain-containing protein [Herbaspirillum sp. WKF16]|uniref:DUF3300 domain-containing protein n=1 Tax=Herbaspirillum sp. WKF16 TaxID=3028312 RepID=UPI0023A992E9|nr:DUF3300 domain-containing protein [Herbaspirillum sp. WKF16]WDZ94531.1 DUF3300 domain-containing protein [Herbaspirillum sp. WKF16]
MNKKTLAWAACLVFSLVSGMPAAQAQSNYPAYPPPPASYTQEQLDQMLAPVALYPDSLLAQVLMASTYPLEVVQAQRFVEARPGLQGDGLARSVAPMPWDPSVKALVQFPSVLAMMNDRLDWMQQMGQAFLSQQGAVMDTVQNLRERAQVAGTLQSSPQQRVVADEGLIMIEPINSQVVYVPYYNPVVAYGSWWWPAAQPVYWAPPPRYRPPHYNPGVTVGITFGSGIGVMRAAFGDARPDWRQRQVMVTQTRITNVTNNNVTVNRNVTVNQRPVVWHHDARHGNPRPQAPQNAQQAGGRPEAPRGAPPPAQAHVAPPVAQAPQARPAPPAPMPAQQQRVMQQDRERREDAREQQVAQVREVQTQQRQREQQAQQQQRQREQMINDQQRQREQMANEQRQQQQNQERQVQQRQQQMHEMQMQQAQQARDQQRQVQQQQQQQQQRQQQEQARQQQEQARHQQEQSRREQQARPPRDDGR